MSRPGPRRGPGGPRPAARQRPPTLWDRAARWYDALVGEEGSYFHQEVVLPGTLALLAARPGERVLDLCCGQGVLARLAVGQDLHVTGLDSSRELLQAARARSDRSIRFVEADARDPAALAGETFDAVACVLALQNVAELDPVCRNVARWLAPAGRFVAVVMHPCFRIPRQSHWGFDAAKKTEYRRVERYLTPLDIPILGRKEDGEQPYTLTHHRPLQAYVNALGAAGLAVDRIEEWVSNKASQGRDARAHNRARREFPLFLALRARPLANPA